jgi:hypothetical protein
MAEKQAKNSGDKKSWEKSSSNFKIHHSGAKMRTIEDSEPTWCVDVIDNCKKQGLKGKS